MKYRLINLKTKETYLCDKVTIDGFDYYVSETEQINWKDLVYNKETNDYFRRNINAPLECNGIYFKIIATTNLNIDIPKVVDEVEVLANQWSNGIIEPHIKTAFNVSFKEGYSKSQETHSHSDEDMIEFAQWTKSNGTATKELLECWKSQQPKVIYIA